MGEVGTFAYCWWECKLVPPLWKQYEASSEKKKLELPYDPVVPLLAIDPKELKAASQEIQTPLRSLSH